MLALVPRPKNGLGTRLSACVIGRARTWGRTTAHAPYTQNGDYGNAGRALSFGLAEFIGSRSVGYGVDWCINHRLQLNQFVSRHDEEEEEEDGENRG